jgi:hypothetical protein
MDQEKAINVRKPRKDLADAIRQVQEAGAAKAVVIPPLSPHEALQWRGQQVTQDMNKSHLVAAEVYYEIFQQKLWEYFGYAAAPQYFEAVIGISYRSAQQAISIWEAHLAIPEAARADARQALEEMGVYRAAVIAPVLKEQPLQWTEWTSAGADKGLSREALQEKVSKTRGLPPKHSEKHGDRLYHSFMSRLDKDQREEAEEIIKAGMKVAETDDFAVIMDLALIEAGPAWIAQAERILAGHGNA